MKPDGKILIADDHPIFREGLRRVIEKQNRWQIVGEAEDGETALQLIKSLKPSMAILDVVMPKLSGLALAREVKARKLPVSIIFLTMFKEEDMFNEAMDLGIRGYVLKENAASDLVNGLRAIEAGEYFISPAISHFLVRRGERARGLQEEKPGLQSLTPSERRILQLISVGKTSKEIARELFISPKTVENHRLNIAAKLEVHGNNALLKFALENRSRI